jgi:hypothetical protein
VCSKLLPRSARNGPGDGCSDRSAWVLRTAGCSDFSRAVGCPSSQQGTCVSFGAVSHPPRVSPADVCGTRPPFGEGGPDHPEIEGLGSPPSHGKVPLIGGSRRSAGFPEDRPYLGSPGSGGWTTHPLRRRGRRFEAVGSERAPRGGASLASRNVSCIFLPVVSLVLRPARGRTRSATHTPRSGRRVGRGVSCSDRRHG